MNKILILGANSTAGSYATYYFSMRGFAVTATSRSKQSSPCSLPYLFKTCPNVNYFIYDLNWPVDKQVQFLTSLGPSYVLNFASQSMVAQSWNHPIDWMKTNCVGQTSLLEALRSLDRLQRYVHFSTPEVYGSTEGWVSESHRFNPSTPYASSRALGDMNTRLWASTYSIPTTITRAANIYSEGQHIYRIIPRAFVAAMSPDRPLTVDGDGGSIRSFIHMEDVCDFLLHCMSSPRIIDEYHISSSACITISDLISLIFRMCGASTSDTSRLNYGPDRKGKDQAYLLSPQKALSDYGWSTKIQLSTGLSRVYEWLRTTNTTSMPLDYVHKA